jgi:glycosyltransferase involved in cell wall biosynthesis
MKNGLRVSVCMLTYNHEQFISDALHSVLMQNIIDNVEIIIGDDNSTDQTVAKIKAIKKKYSNIHLVERSKNIGMMANFIDILKRCKGEYVAFCEGDDYWLDSEKLSKQIHYFEKNNKAEIVFTNIRVLNQSTLKFMPNWARIDKVQYTTNDLINHNVISTCSVMLRNKYITSILDSLIHFSIGDWPLYLLILEKSGGEAHYIEDETAVYRQHVSGFFSSIPNEEKIKLIIGVYEKLFMLNQFKRYRNNIFQKLSKSYYHLGCISVSPKQSSLYFIKSARYIQINNLFYTTASIFRFLQNKIFSKN